MISLPVEVLGLVFLQLSQSDLLECMKVCRQWYDIIYQHNVFRAIYIDSLQELDKLIKRVERDPTLGAKVEQLYLKLHGNDDFDDMILLECFPNLSEFTSNKYVFYDFNNTSLIQVECHPWCKTIEKIVESRSNPNSIVVLNSGLCKNLSYLEVSGTRTESVRHLVKVLVNAPALKSLCLRDYSVSFYDLELLHRVLPSLETFSLESFTFDCTSFPLTVVPATSLKSFKGLFISVENLSDYSTYYRYISQKYTEIEELALDMGALSPYNPESIQAYAEYKAAIKSHLRILGLRLKSLSVHYTSAINDFSNGFDLTILDDCDCQIKQLRLISEYNYSLLQRMPYTAQLYYLQSLEIKRLGCNKNGNVSLEWLRQTTVLKHLNITFSSYGRPQKLYSLNLSHFLKLLSETKVEYLILNHLQLTNDSSNETHVHTALKELDLRGVTFKESTDVALSQAFPNMRRLKLHHCSLPGSAFLLPNSYLSYLEILSNYRDTNGSVLVNTLNNNQQRLYTPPKREYILNTVNSRSEKEKLSYFISNPSRPFDKETDIPLLTITCKALWNFVMEIGLY